MGNRFTSPCEGCPYHKVSHHTHTCRRRVVGFYFQPGQCGVHQRMEYALAWAREENAGALAELFKGR